MDVTTPPGPCRASWITDPAELDQWLTDNQGPPLALDTEFERVNTFFPIPGLVQLGLASDYRLVDPSVAEASSVFRQRLADPSYTKLLYAMSEDMELFRHWLGIEPAGVIDLQIGAAMAGAGFSVGYARLVERLFDEVLDKSATRSDWLARPLSEAQERYATDDIRFLEPMYHWVWNTLEERDLTDALRQETARFADELAAQDDPSGHYKKIRGGWALSRQQQGVLKALAQWREEESKRRDRPRNRVVADALLIAIAEKMPGNTRELSSVSDLPPAVIRRYGNDIVNLVAEAGAQDNSKIEPISPPLSKQDQMFYKQLKRVMVEAAETRDIPVELLAPRKRLEAVIQTRDLSAGLFAAGWRSDVISPFRERLEALLSS